VVNPRPPRYRLPFSAGTMANTSAEIKEIANVNAIARKSRWADASRRTAHGRHRYE